MEKYVELLEISICSSMERLRETGSKRRFDIVLMDAEMARDASFQNANLALLLWDGVTPLSEQVRMLKVVNKYQRVSSIISKVLEYYAEVSSRGSGFGRTRGVITVVWSPIGGCGKTTAALAYAAKNAADGKKTVYLNLENFCSTPVYFPENGKSISTILGRLDSNVELLLQSIRQQDSGSGIYYFSKPENYDDINALTENEFALLTENCAEGTDEVVVDLSSDWNGKIKKMLELADRILLVMDTSNASQPKWEQFKAQNNIYQEICPKSTLVMNRAGKMEHMQDMKTVVLPCVQSKDPVVVYKTLSVGYWK
ncbi:MAG: hypothetical protein IJ955_00145 [Oscillospiraceae bacterium]|nr:hypothetical protein [Oscillospiraceae bacterium]